jgi:hypothetical protein
MVNVWRTVKMETEVRLAENKEGDELLRWNHTKPLETGRMPGTSTNTAAAFTRLQ